MALKVEVPASGMALELAKDLAKRSDVARSSTKSASRTAKVDALDAVETLRGMVPASVCAAWCEASGRDPKDPKAMADFYECLTGLFVFLACAEVAGNVNKVSLPSRAADALWCVFRAKERAVLFNICSTYFKCAANLPETLFDTKLDSNRLAKCFYFSCLVEELTLTSDRLPMLFTLDHRLEFGQGTRFIRMAKPQAGIYYCWLDAQGKSADREWYLVPSISNEGFTRLGLDVSLLKTSSGVLASCLGLALRSIAGMD